MAVERASLIRDAGVSLVLDVGANEGQYARELRASGYEGDIVSFEPLSDAYARLQAAAAGDPRWQTRNLAVGPDLDRMEIHVSANSYSSSLLPITDLCVDAAPDAAYVGAEEVALVPLDSLEIPDTASILVKADVQGFEAPVLRGAARLLLRVAMLELELSLVPLYRGQQLAHEVCALVRQSGFVPVAVGNPFCHPATGEILSLDALFRRLDDLPAA